MVKLRLVAHPVKLATVNNKEQHAIFSLLGLLRDVFTVDNIYYEEKGLPGQNIEWRPWRRGE